MDRARTFDIPALKARSDTNNEQKSAYSYQNEHKTMVTFGAGPIKIVSLSVSESRYSCLRDITN